MFKTEGVVSIDCSLDVIDGIIEYDVLGAALPW